MYIIHASITEVSSACALSSDKELTSLAQYLIFFGTPIGTEGHTGRHTVRVWSGRQYMSSALIPQISCLKGRRLLPHPRGRAARL